MTFRFFAVVAFILFVVAAVLAWMGKAHSDAVAYAGLACLAVDVAWPGARVGS
jgi:predicted N-acetyltransferase YhbS